MATSRFPRPAILDEIPRDKPAVIEASAGTGKTFTLEHLLIELLLKEDVSISEILVVTFTEKATAELRARLRGKLLELAQEPSGVSTDGPDWDIDDAAREKIRRAIQNFDTATISTLHAFCQRVLLEHAFAQQRPFTQTQVDAHETFGRCLREALRTDLASDPKCRDFLSLWLRTQSVDNLSKLLERCLVERGELVPLLDEARLNEAIALFVAAAEHGTEKLRGELARAKIHGGTAKAAVTRIAELEALVGSRTDLPQLLAAISGWRTKENGFEEARWRLANVDGEATSAYRAALSAMESAAIPFPAAVVQTLLPQVRARLQRDKQSGGLFDFDDMVRLVQESLAGPHGTELAERLRTRFRFALIDEFQDTDEVQWDLFRRIFLETNRGGLYLIGDPKQAIYSFRGADVSAYLAAKKQVVEAGGSLVTLGQNFRASRPLLAVTNHFFDQQAATPFFSGAIRYEQPLSGGTTLSVRNSDGTPATPVHVFDLISEEKLSGPDLLREVLAPRLVQEIAQLLDSDQPRLRLSSERGPLELRPQDIFVLTRTDREGRTIGDALLAAGIAHAHFKQDGLYATDEAGDVIDILAAVADPTHRATVRRALLTPFFAFSLEDLVLLGERPEIATEANAQLRAWKQLADAHDFTRLFAQIPQQSGLYRRERFFDQQDRVRTNYQHLFELLLEETAQTPSSLEALVRRLRAYRNGEQRPLGESGGLQRIEPNPNAVQIMTMHKAKGLEAAVVFIAGGLSMPPADSLSVFHAQGRRQAYVGTIRDSAITQAVLQERGEEDERLLYVALTRAKARLYLPLWRTAPANFRGGYAKANARLAAIVNDASDQTRLFSIEPIQAPPPLANEVVNAIATAPWRPPPELLEESADAPFDALRRHRAGPWVTSYSGLMADRDAPEARPSSAPTEQSLPGGATIGLFLHDVLQRLSFESVHATASVEKWRRLPEVAALLGTAAIRHDVERRYLEPAAELLHTALRAPIHFAENRRLEGLATATRVVREMEFLFPVAEPNEISTERGYVKGFVDLAFEHDGLCYIADWKSDRLAPESERGPLLGAFVERHYGLQAKLYLIALARLLELRSEEDHKKRFGGMAYCFLRSMRGAGDGADGVHFLRPTWSELTRWQDEIAGGDWGSGIAT